MVRPRVFNDVLQSVERGLSCQVSYALNRERTAHPSGHDARKGILTRVKRNRERPASGPLRGTREGAFPLEKQGFPALPPRLAPSGLHPWKTCRQADPEPLTRDEMGTSRKPRRRRCKGRLRQQGQGILAEKQGKRSGWRGCCGCHVFGQSRELRSRPIQEDFLAASPPNTWGSSILNRVPGGQPLTVRVVLAGDFFRCPEWPL